MKVVLVKPVAGLGKSGEIKEVKEGFARNYLFPKGLAVQKEDEEARVLVARLESKKAKQAQEEKDLSDQISKLEGLKLEVAAKTNNKGQLFAAISKEEIKKIVYSKSGIKVIDVQGLPIKNIGKHELELDFGHNHKIKIDLTVNSE